MNRKHITNDPSQENARLIVENARLRESFKQQKDKLYSALYEIEEIAINENNKKILDVISIMRNNRKGENHNGIYT